jgi:hypothetical protein
VTQSTYISTTHQVLQQESRPTQAIDDASTHVQPCPSHSAGTATTAIQNTHSRHTHLCGSCLHHTPVLGQDQGITTQSLGSHSRTVTITDDADGHLGGPGVIQSEPSPPCTQEQQPPTQPANLPSPVRNLAPQARAHVAYHTTGSPHHTPDLARARDRGRPRPVVYLQHTTQHPSHTPAMTHNHSSSDRLAPQGSHCPTSQPQHLQRGPCRAAGLWSRHIHKRCVTAPQRRLTRRPDATALVHMTRSGLDGLPALCSTPHAPNHTPDTQHERLHQVGRGAGERGLGKAYDYPGSRLKTGRRCLYLQPHGPRSRTGP